VNENLTRLLSLQEKDREIVARQSDAVAIPKRRDALAAKEKDTGARLEAEKKNLETVKKSNEAFSSKKGADAMAPYADDAVESDQAGGADAKGKKEIEKGMKVFWKAFPDLKIEVPNMWAAGDYVVAEGTFSGTNSGPLGKMPKTGKQVTGQFAEVFKLKDGKITQVWRFRNGMAMAAQLGLGGEPPKGGDMKKGAEPAKTK